MLNWYALTHLLGKKPTFNEKNVIYEAFSKKTKINSMTSKDSAERIIY